MNDDSDRSKRMPLFIEAEPCTGDELTPWGTRTEAFYKYDDEESYKKGEWSELHIHEYDMDGNWLGESIIR